MQLLKQSKSLEYRWRDIVFKIRAKASMRDTHEVVEFMSEATDINGSGQMKMTLTKLAPRVLEMFVESWSGVTDEHGKDVPWSLENLYKLPADSSEDVVLLLAGFVLNNTGLMASKEEAGKKKG